MKVGSWSVFVAIFAYFSGAVNGFLHLGSKHSIVAPLKATATESMAAEVKVGDKISDDITMKELTADMDKAAVINLAELIAGKKVAIFGVPGAFTPGCSKSHLPSFIEAQDSLKTKGVEADPLPTRTRAGRKPQR